MVAEILVPQAKGKDSLLEQFLDREVDRFWIAEILETAGKVANDARPRFHLAEQQAAGIRSERAAVESSRDPAAGEGLEIKRSLDTLCNHEAASLLLEKFVVQKQLMPKGAAFFYGGCEKIGLGSLDWRPRVAGVDFSRRRDAVASRAANQGGGRLDGMSGPARESVIP
jgi:hypothetical protein